MNKSNERRPTRRSEWVKAGERATIDGHTIGRVLRVVSARSLPYALVEWPSGSTGRHSITTLRKVTASTATPGKGS